MRIEDRLKRHILNRYTSIREFTIDIGMPYGTLDSILKRGIGNASITNVVKICKALGISADELAEGRITPAIKPVSERPEETIEISDVVANAKTQLICHDHYLLNGKLVSDEAVRAVINGIEVSLELVERSVKADNRTITQFNKNEVFSEDIDS